jgi:hypothetical protein
MLTGDRGAVRSLSSGAVREQNFAIVSIVWAIDGDAREMSDFSHRRDRMEMMFVVRGKAVK